MLQFNPTDSPSNFAQQLETDTLDSLNIDGQTVAHTVIFATTWQRRRSPLPLV